MDLAQHYEWKCEKRSRLKYIAELEKKKVNANMWSGERRVTDTSSGIKFETRMRSELLLAELAHELDQRGERMLDRLEQLHRRHGAQGGVGVIGEGWQGGQAQIDAVVPVFVAPPSSLAVKTWLKSSIFNWRGAFSARVVLRKVSQASSNVMQFVTAKDRGSRRVQVAQNPKSSATSASRKIGMGSQPCRRHGALADSGGAHFLALGV